MAKRNYFKNSGKNKYTASDKRIKQLAYDFGCIQRGLKNPDSQITASFNHGLNKQKYVKRSMY